MGTVVAIDSAGGAVVAGDTLATSDGVVTGAGADRVVDLGAVGIGVVGDRGDADEFVSKVERAVRSYRLEHDEEIRIERLARTASDHAATTGVEAVVGARDDDGVARVRALDADGGIRSGPRIALGTGAELALGRLEAGDPSDGLEDAVSLAREAVRTASERDPETGGDVDVWRLEDADDADRGGRDSRDDG